MHSTLAWARENRMAPTLVVRDLVTQLKTQDGMVPIVNGVSFAVGMRLRPWS